MLSSATHQLSPPAACSVFYKGNSDPFNVFPVKITPRVSELMQFDKLHIWPAVHAKNTQNTPMEQRYSSKWGCQNTALLHDQLRAYSHLSRVAVVLSTFSAESEYPQLVLLFQNKASALLRSHTAQTLRSGLCDEKLYNAIWALTYAHTFAGDYDAAAVHLKMLNSLLKSHTFSDRAPFDLHLLLKIVDQDMHRAVLSLSRPIFDVRLDGWVAKLFSPILMATENEIPAAVASEAELNLETSLDYNFLRGVFVEARRLNIILEILMTSPAALSDVQRGWFYLMIQATLMLGQVISHIMDYIVPSKKSNGTGEIAPGLSHGAYVHAYASLALLSWSRHVSNVESFPMGKNAKIYAAGPLLLERLRDALLLAEAEATTSDKVKFANIRLWALYVGGLVEQDQMQGGGCDASQPLWFTTALCEQARGMGVMTWQSCRKVLSRLVYMDFAKPHGSTWFHEAFRLLL